MFGLTKADNQAITSRFGEATWLTDFITPDNPDVMLRYDELTHDINSTYDRILSLWQNVANIPYREFVGARISVDGRSSYQKDTWLYPAEVIRLAPRANCSNKSFLLTSLLLNELPEQQVKCVLGHLRLDGIGAHAWVEIELDGSNYILEGTQPNIEKAIIPASLAGAYEPVVYFSNDGVYTLSSEADGVARIIEEHFGFCAIPFLREYLCDRCRDLEV